MEVKTDTLGQLHHGTRRAVREYMLIARVCMPGAVFGESRAQLAVAGHLREGCRKLIWAGVLYKRVSSAILARFID